MVNSYKPEGMLIESTQNKTAQKNIAALHEAMNQGMILEGRTLVCDAGRNLLVELGCCRGIIPRQETVLGIDDGQVRDIAIISRVNKPVCFIITGFTTSADGTAMAVLSRKRVQEMCRDKYISTLRPGDIIDVRVTHMESFGCFVDIGCGITSLIPIDTISISRIAHPKDRFKNGQSLKAVVKSIDEIGRITLSHKELLGTWEENAAGFEAGETVAGIIRSVESYGVFVELTPNLAGLAENRENARPGQHASVYIKSLIPEKMKIKLIIVDAFEAAYIPPDPVYFINGNHISSWRYSPECAERTIETEFDPV